MQQALDEILTLWRTGRSELEAKEAKYRAALDADEAGEKVAFDAFEPLPSAETLRSFYQAMPDELKKRVAALVRAGLYGDSVQLQYATVQVDDPHAHALNPDMLERGIALALEQGLALDMDVSWAPPEPEPELPPELEEPVEEPAAEPVLDHAPEAELEAESEEADAGENSEAPEESVAADDEEQ